MSTLPSPRKSRPSTARTPCCPPTRSARKWPGCAASTTGSSATATAPAATAGLRVRADLRDLHLLPDQHPVPPRPASPARRRHDQAPGPPRAALHLAARPHRPGRLMNRPPRLTRPGKLPAPGHRRRQPARPHRGDRPPRPAPHPLLARRLRRPAARPGQPDRPGRKPPAPSRP